jgi:superfamily II DNA helicase RecQ
MQLDQAAIQAAVVERVADEIQSGWDWKADARKMITAKIDAAFIEGVADVVDATVKQAVEDSFDREYSKSDVFGISSGPKTTIRKELARLIDGYWSQKVDRYGKPDTSTYGDKVTRAEWHMMQVCGEGFSKQLKQDVVNIAAHFKDGLRAQLRSETDKMLNNLFKVKSKQDAEEKLY